MSRFSRWLSWLLLALWLPATQHCALEAIGILADSCPEHCSDQKDNCGTVENGAYKPAATTALKAPALAWAARQLSSDLALPIPSTTPQVLPGSPGKRAPDWVAPWTFARRAAPAPRAPAFACA